MRTYSSSRTVLVEDLINTYDTYLEQPEKLRTPADLDAFLRDHGFPVRSASTPSDLEQVRILRDELRQLWNSETVEAVATPLNALLSQTQIMPRLSAAAADLWSIDYIIPQDATLIDRLSAETALGILTALEQYGIERLRHCDSAPCQDVFVDMTRNRSRRFCDDRCANRYNIAAFRRRRHDES